MRAQFVICAIAAAVMANIYYDGKLVQAAFANKKYFQMAGVAAAAAVLYYMVTHNPFYARKIVAASSEYVKYMPVDRNTRDLLSPFLAMSGGAGAATASPGWWAGTATAQALPPQAAPLAGGARRFKRAVSETKKKFVASSQSWRCGHCKSALNHTFEVDHIVSLNSGGSNEVDNLVALCPTCHREKTARENM